MNRKVRSTFRKCDVIYCNKRVYSQGAICPECIEKICNDSWCIDFCVKCKRIIKFMHIDIPELQTSERIKEKVCPDCLLGPTDCILF